VAIVRTIIWVLVGVASLIATGWLFARYTGGLGNAAELAGQVSPGRWVIVALLTAAFYSLDWLRYWCLFRLLGHALPYSLGIRLVAISYFVSSLTPSSELHLPVMVIVLVVYGFPVADATAATITKSIYMVTWVIITGLVGLHVADDGRIPSVIDDHLGLWLISPGVIVGLLVLFIVAPGPIHRLCARQLASSPGPRRKKFFEGLDKVPTAIGRIGRSFTPMHVGVHLASLAFLAVAFAIGHILANGVGATASVPESYSAFSTGMMVSYIAPVPGSIGVTEAATAHLLDPAMAPPAMTAAILARICTWYVAAMVGAVLFVVELRRVGWERFTRWLRAGKPDA
jgi:uncharacterized membrane protein YbhN (UPF0104 family)